MIYVVEKLALQLGAPIAVWRLCLGYIARRFKFVFPIYTQLLEGTTSINLSTSARLSCFRSPLITAESIVRRGTAKAMIPVDLTDKSLVLVPESSGIE